MVRLRLKQCRWASLGRLTVHLEFVVFLQPHPPGAIKTSMSQAMLELEFLRSDGTRTLEFRKGGYKSGNHKQPSLSEMH